MSKIFEWNPVKYGNFRDVVTNTPMTNNGVVIKKGDKGHGGYFDIDNELDCNKIFNTNIISQTSFFAYVKVFSDFSNIRHICGQYVAGQTNRFLFYFNENDLIYYADGLGVNAIVLNALDNYKGQWILTGFIIEGSSLSLYINNQVVGQFTITTTPWLSTNFKIGLNDTSIPSAIGDINISNCYLYDHALSQTERNKLYAEFLNSYSPVETKTNFEVIKPRDLSYLVDDTLSNDLVTNGGFLAGAAGWTSILNTLDTSNNTGKITNTGTNGKLYQAVNVVSGRKNKINITVLNGTINTYVSTTTDSGGSIISTGNVGQGIYSLEFIPSVDLVYILIYNIGSTGAIGEVDNVYMVDYSGLVASYNMVPSAGGVLTDISGNNNTATIHGCISTKDGLRFDGVDDYVDTDILLNYQKFSISTRIKLNYTNSLQFIIDSRDGNANGISLYLDPSNRLMFSINENNITITENYNTYLTISCIYDGISMYIYINGILISSNMISTIVNIVNYIKIGCRNYSEPILFFKGEIQDVRIYNRALSEQEVIQYHNSFVQPQLIETFKDTPVGNYPIGWTKISGDAEVDEYYIQDEDFIQDNSFIDLTSDWTTVDCNLTFIDGLYSINYIADTQYIYKNISNIKIGHKYKLSVTVKTSSGNCEFRPFLYNTFTASLGDIVGNVRGDNIATEEWQTFNYEFIASGDWSTVGIHSVLTSGSFLFKDFLLQEIPPLEGFKSGTKLLKQTVVGINAIPSKTAYGTWEFDIIKYDDINVIKLFFINDNNSTSNNNGYEVRLRSDEAVSLVTYNNGSASVLFASSGLYIQNNTWYKIKITRTSEGEFTVYIKGGNFGNEYVLVDVTGGSGTNPVTSTDYNTSNFFVSDLDSGDSISNIKILNGIVQ